MADADEREQRLTERLEQGSNVILKGEQWAELRRLSEEELAVRHDAALSEASRSSNPSLGHLYVVRAEVYSIELTRRENARQGERMEKLTRSLNRLTWWLAALTVLIAVATLVGVGLTAWAVLYGG